MISSTQLPGGAAALLLIVLVMGCASSGGTPHAVDDPDERDRYAVACEVAFEKLSTLISQRTTESGFPQADLLEAQELYRMAREVYLEREYSLALELIEEGIHLVKE